MALADLGFKTLKFFPAESSGGIGWLKSIAGPLPDLRFCPTGGIDAKNAAAYLALQMWSRSAAPGSRRQLR